LADFITQFIQQHFINGTDLKHLSFTDFFIQHAQMKHNRSVVRPRNRWEMVVRSAEHGGGTGATWLKAERHWPAPEETVMNIQHR
jgi:hypothetical protein